MTYLQFSILLYQKLFIFLLIWILLLFFGLFLFRKYIYSIIDPLFFTIILSFSGYTIVFFLFLLGYIKNYYLYSFILTQSAYFIGFFTVKPIKRKLIKKSNESPDLFLSSRMYLVYIFSYFLYLLSNMVIYLHSGIPLFAALGKSPGEIAGKNGFGLFIAAIGITPIVLYVVLFYKMIIIKKYYILDKIILFSVIINSLFSGSKSTFLSIIFVLFYVGIFSWRFGLNINKIITKLGLSFFSLAFFAAIFVNYIRLGTRSIIVTLGSLFLRIIFTGDIYMMAYPFNNLAKIHIAHGNFFMGLFGWELAGLKLIPWNKVPTMVGAAVSHYVFHGKTPFAPNSRQNVFGLYYLGFWGSIPFSLILGFISSYIRNRFYYKVKANLEGMVFYVLFTSFCFDFDIDVPYAVHNYFSIIFIFLPLYLISYLISVSIKHKDNRDLTYFKRGIQISKNE